MTTANRIYYACQSVQIYPGVPVDMNLTTAENKATVLAGTPETVQGLQSVGMNTNFNLEPVYQLGQLSLYENVEDVPEVEISLNKALDGRATLYQLAMGADGANTQLTTCASKACGVLLSLYPDSVTSATGVRVGVVTCAPAYLSSVTYNFPTEGNFTEEVQLVSNDKAWGSAGSANTAPTAENTTDKGIFRRQHIDLDSSIFPAPGSGGIPLGVKIQSITVSLNLGRESIFNLGERTPSFRYVNFPVEVTCEIECIATKGDEVGAEDVSGSCTNLKQLADKTIKIITCDGMTIDLGTKNKLTSVNYQGGDTGGGNATITYSYQTYNDFIYTPPTVAGGQAVDVTPYDTSEE